MKKLGILVVLILATCRFVSAAPIVSNTWDATVEGWNIVDISGGAAYGTTAWNNGGGDGYLEITGGGSQAGFPTDRIRSGGTPAFTNLTMGTRLLFEFYAAGSAPNNLDLYFIGASGQEWRSTISVIAGWNTGLGDSILYDGSWWLAAGPGVDDAASYTNAAVDVAELGLLLTYRTLEAAQVYGVDDFWLDNEPWPEGVPEPGTYAMLGTVFISLGITFRRRLNDSIGALKKNLKS